MTFDRSRKVGGDGERLRPLDDEMTAAFMRQRGYSADEIAHVLGLSDPYDDGSADQAASEADEATVLVGSA